MMSHRSAAGPVVALLSAIGLSPSVADAQPTDRAARLMRRMRIVAVEDAPDAIFYNCFGDSRSRRRTIIRRQGKTERWVVSFAIGYRFRSLASIASSRFFCDGDIEFLPDQLNFEQCEAWHERLRGLAPSPKHRLRHIFREQGGEVRGVFCAAPLDCLMMEVWLEDGKPVEVYSHRLDYSWD